MFDSYHRGKGWDELGYHFVIGNGTKSGDGEIEVGGRWPEQRAGAHAGSKEFNTRGIGICLVGDFETGGEPTKAQYRRLLELCAYLASSFHISVENVKLHKDVGKTKCPGKQFPFAQFKRDLEEEMGRS